MSRVKPLRSIVVVLGMIIAALFLAVSPASADANVCSGAQCTFVKGSGNHVDYVTSKYSGDTRFPYYTTGHVEVRWNAGGADHVKNSPQGGWSNMYAVRVNLNVTVTANTYVCSRFWRWNGSSWILPWGNWVCVKTHP